jgi:hypothetical protein
MLGKAALMAMESTPHMRPFPQAASALLQLRATWSMANGPFLLLNCPLLRNSLRSASSDNSIATTFSTTFLMLLSRDIQ